MTLAKLWVAAWLASFAMLAGSLMPTLTHLLGATAPSGAPWAILCTSKGVVRVAPPADAPAPLPTGDRDKFAATHCPFCLPHGGAFALPSSPAVGSPAIASEQFRPAALPQPARLLPTWASAQPRGPPRFAS